MICGDVRIHSWWAFTSLCHTCVCVWRVVGSNRLWDAIENGAIPVITDPRQRSVLPFESLWRSMTMQLSANANSSTSLIAKSLIAKSAEVRDRWSTYMAALATAKPIVSWLHPRSVTLRAYVQLLVDRIKSQPCGPCVRTEQRKEKCRQPRCSKHTCAWVQISDSKACALNADGEAFRDFDTVLVNSIRECQIACEKDSECLAVDIHKMKVMKLKKAMKCIMFRHACSKPLTYPGSSYRLQLLSKS